MSGGVKPWTNPYITDGLAALYDAYWNAGGGLHDSRKRMVDICGLCPDLDHGADYDESDRSISFNGEHCTSSCPVLENETVTIEMVFRVDEANQNRALFYNNGRRIITDTVDDVGQRVRIVTWFTYQGSTRESHAFEVNSSTRQPRFISLSSSFDVVGYNTYFPVTINGARHDFRRAGALNAIDPVRESNFDLGSYNCRWKFWSLRIYGRKLTESEIAANYAIDQDRFGLP